MEGRAERSLVEVGGEEELILPMSCSLLVWIEDGSHYSLIGVSVVK